MAGISDDPEENLFDFLSFAGWITNGFCSSAELEFLEELIGLGEGASEVLVDFELKGDGDEGGCPVRRLQPAIVAIVTIATVKDGTRFISG